MNSVLFVTTILYYDYLIFSINDRGGPRWALDEKVPGSISHRTNIRNFLNYILVMITPMLNVYQSNGIYFTFLLFYP